MKQFIETPQDVLDILKKAKEDGHEWADSAIEQFDEEFCKEELLHNIYQYGIYSAIITGFRWHSTKERQNYWEGICEANSFKKNV